MNKKISIEEFTPELQAKYTVTVEEAHELLLSHGVTKSKNVQVTMRWVRDNEFDAILIGKGRVETRKWLINKESLLNYIEFKTLTFAKFKQMKEEIEALRAFKYAVESTPIVEKKEPVKKEIVKKETTKKTTPKTNPTQKKETVATKVVEQKK